MKILLDNGHGGIIDGEYQTPGKRSPMWADGSQLFEGDFNRKIVNGIARELEERDIEYEILVPELEDIRLSERVKRANKNDPDGSLYLSIHSNAGGGNGFEVYTSPGQSMSDDVATLFGEEFKKIFPNRPLRADFDDGDLDKENRFYVLTKTKMPSILTENFFMDNEDECKNILMTEDGRERIVEFHVNAIEDMINVLTE